MTKAFIKTLFICIAAAASVPVVAVEPLPFGPTNEFTVHDGSWYMYKRVCSGCHGVTGQGIFPVGVPLRGNAFVVNARPADIVAVIRNGRKDDTKRYPMYIREDNGYMNMPPIDRLVISDSEVDKLAAYLKGPFQQGRFNRP